MLYKIILISALVFASALSKAQNDKQDTLYLLSLFNEGKKAYFDDNFESAKKKLLKFVSISIPFKDSTNWSHRGYKYLETKNMACFYLKQIFFIEEDYTEALYYNELQTTKLREHIVGCFDGVMNHWYKYALFASRCHEMLGNYEHAINFIYTYWGISQGVMERFVMLAGKKDGKENLQNEAKRIISENLIDYNEGAFTIKLSGYKLYISRYRHKYQDVKDENQVVVSKKIIEPTEDEITEAKNKIREDFKNHKLYKLIMEN